MKTFRSLFKFPGLPLGSIILFAFVLRVYNLNYNSPFFDEAQYLVLGRKVMAGHWQEADPFSWVGGMPLFYPTLVAIFGFFGIIGARFLSVLTGTLSVYLMFEFAKSLSLSKNEKVNEFIGLTAAAFLTVLPIPLYLSRLAIYDIVSFTLFLAGLVFLQKGLNLKNYNLREQETLFFVAASAFFLSFLAKYVTIIFFPWLFVWGVYQSKKSGLSVSSKLFIYFVAPLTIATLVYLSWNFAELFHFLTEQAVNPQGKLDEIVIRFGQYTIPVLTMAIFGASLYLSKSQIFPTFMLLIGATLIPVAHLLVRNLISVHQHIFLTTIFLLPATGYFLVWILERQRLAGITVISIVLVSTFIISQQQARTLESSWPNTTAVMAYLKANTTGHERLLTFEDDVAILSLPNLRQENIIGIYNFPYKEQLGEKAYNLALQDGYFNFVLFDEESGAEIKNLIRNSLTNHYKPVYSQHPFKIYKLNST